MATNGRRIGKDAELEAAGRLNALFGTEFYRSQQHKGAVDAPDIIDDDHPELAVEVKRRSDYSVKLHRAVEKARSETDDEGTALVIHRIPGERWLLTVDLFEAPELVAKLGAILFEQLGFDDDGGTFETMLDHARETQVEVEIDGISGKKRIASAIKQAKGAKP
jgi:hypothetical protein